MIYITLVVHTPYPLLSPCRYETITDRKRFRNEAVIIRLLLQYKTVRWQLITSAVSGKNYFYASKRHLPITCIYMYDTSSTIFVRVIDSVSRNSRENEMIKTIEIISFFFFNGASIMTALNGNQKNLNIMRDKSRSYQRVFFKFFKYLTTTELYENTFINQLQYYK